MISPLKIITLIQWSEAIDQVYSYLDVYVIRNIKEVLEGFFQGVDSLVKEIAWTKYQMQQSGKRCNWLWQYQF